ADDSHEASGDTDCGATVTAPIEKGHGKSSPVIGERRLISDDRIGRDRERSSETTQEWRRNDSLERETEVFAMG
ncbi:hypothetical protein, partial [Escherichia coli]|uniref:hypothetical protein n=1 Tax=Escherichia coli TaxID=562 RepID=UPI002244C27B